MDNRELEIDNDSFSTLLFNFNINDMKHYKKQMVVKPEQYVNTAPARLTHSVTINAPIEKIWAIVDDTPNFDKWFKGVKWGKVEIETEKGLGAKRLAQLNNNKYYEEIIAYEPLKKWGFSMIESNSGMCKTITEVIYLDKVDANKTKVTYKGGYEYNGIFKYMKPVMNGAVTNIWKNAFKGLKEFAETGKTLS